MKGRCDKKKTCKTHHILVFFRPAFQCYTLLATLVCLFLICSMTSQTIVFITPTKKSQEISFPIHILKFWLPVLTIILSWLYSRQPSQSLWFRKIEIRASFMLGPWSLLVNFCTLVKPFQRRSSNCILSLN